MSSDPKENPAAGTNGAAKQSNIQHPQYNDIDRARNALSAITPDLDRDTWIRVGMAARAAGLGFDDWDAWSSNGKTYQPAAAKSAWRSFKTDQGIGPGTLFWIAGEHGWREHVQPRHKRRSRMNPREVLHALDREALVVAVVASDMQRDGTLDDSAHDRLKTAVARIGTAREVCQ